MEKELDREGDELNWVKKKRLIVSVREKREKRERERKERERRERERGERGGVMVGWPSAHLNMAGLSPAGCTTDVMSFLCKLCMRLKVVSSSGSTTPIEASKELRRHPMRWEAAPTPPPAAASDGRAVSLVTLETLPPE